jgi:endonuclease/exonuclease/phosphatase family metal-dependent hydrolase
MKSILSNEDLRQAALFTVIFLFFFQLVADFVEAVYAFGLMGTGIPNEIVSVLLFFSPILLLIFGKPLASRGLVLLGEVVLICRLIEPMLDTRGKMLVSGIGVGNFLLFLPILLWKLGKAGRTQAAYPLGASLTLALALSVLLHLWNSGSDLSTLGMFQIIGWGLALLAGILLPITFRKVQPTEKSSQPGGSAGFGKVAGLCIGIMAALIMLYFTFTSPNIIARWTGSSYLAILATLAIGMTIFGLGFTARLDKLMSLPKDWLLGWNALFILALVFTILPHQLAFPGEPSGYPFYEPPVTLLAYLPLFIMLFLSPVILVDFTRYSHELLAIQPKARQLGGGFLLGSIFFLLMVLAHIFTTVYDYIPVIGGWFRDKFWLVYLVGGIALALPALGKPKSSQLEKPPNLGWVAMIIPAIYVLAIGGAILVAARPTPVTGADNSLRVMTYNVQQGYSEAGQKNFEGQIRLIKSVDPDLLGLQETDTNRIAGGNSDLVRYFADRLNMYSYYGPKSIPGTFGIALLSKYPIQQPHTFYMFSEGEQTATIIAQVEIAGKIHNIFVTHLGNGGPIVQQEAILEEVGDLENIIAIGDFNFRPDTDQYQLTVERLEDAWLLKWPQGIDDQGLNPTERIDHAFVSPGTVVENARYLTGPESDHPALMVDINW